MSRLTRKFSPIVLATVGLAGCNAVLGIEEPLDTAPAGVGGQMVYVTAGGSSGRGFGGAMTTTGANDAHAAVDPSAYIWAEWPMPNPASAGLPNAQSYDTTSFASVVIDSITGLQWQQASDESSYPWIDASTFCEGLTLTGGGWRLPSRIELLSLVDFTNPNPFIDTNAFPDTPSDYFWTASEFAGDPTFAWHVNFKFGDGIAANSLKTTAHRVRCVR